MRRFGAWIARHRILVLTAGILLLIPCLFGYLHTRVNYDILSYLPKDIDTMTGQQILKEDFGTGAFSMVVVEGLPMKDVSRLKEKIEGVDHVKKVIWRLRIRRTASGRSTMSRMSSAMNR